MKVFVCEKFQCKSKWSRSTRRLSRIKARTFWEAAVGETVVCVLAEYQVIFMTETPLLLRKMEESLRAICHERYHVSILFF